MHWMTQQNSSMGGSLDSSAYKDFVDYVIGVLRHATSTWNKSVSRNVESSYSLFNEVHIFFFFCIFLIGMIALLRMVDIQQDRAGRTQFEFDATNRSHETIHSCH
jgi:hypothetical protein